MTQRKMDIVNPFEPYKHKYNKIINTNKIRKYYGIMVKNFLMENDRFNSQNLS